MKVRLEIDEPTLRGLLAEHTFQEIARLHGCTSRAVARAVRAYGLSSAFVGKAPTPEEDTRIREGLEAGHSASQIAKDLKRSHDFISRRIRYLESTDEDGFLERPDTDGWPVPDTTAADAFAGRRFEDVSADVLNRECPPSRLPINGSALSVAARIRATSYSRSAADLCVDVA